MIHLQLIFSFVSSLMNLTYPFAPFPFPRQILGTKTFPIQFQAGAQGSLEACLKALCADVEAAVKAGSQCIVLTDRQEEPNVER